MLTYTIPETVQLMGCEAMTPVITGTCSTKGQRQSYPRVPWISILPISTPSKFPSSYSPSWAQAFVEQVVLLIAHPPVPQIAPGHMFLGKNHDQLR